MIMDILVTFPAGDRHRRLLEEAGAGCSFTYKAVGDVTERDIENADIIIGNVPPSLLHCPKRLKYLMLESSGADAYTAPGILAPGTLLTSATGAYNLPVAEHGLAMTLTLLKKLHLYRDDQLEGRWTDEGSVGSVAGATVIVVGLGEIGLHYAGMVKALGAHVIGVKRRASECPECVDELCTTDKLTDVIGRGDVVFSVLPGTPAVYHMYNDGMFSEMKKSAVFINVGRGSSVETAALCRALKNGSIAAAGVDVFEEEPLSPDHEAWSIKNLLITPHKAGGYKHAATMDNVANITASNLRAYLSGREPANIIDFGTGYKK